MKRKQNHRIKWLSFFLFWLPLIISAQHISISGKITDDQNRPVYGASIRIPKTDFHTETDLSGIFTFSTLPQKPTKIIVSKAGFEAKEVKIEDQTENLSIRLDYQSSDIVEVVISARRREESAQQVPIPVTSVSGNRVAETGAFNVNRLKELVPTVQLYSSNPRNTAISIRGLGTTFGLTNDGIDPGVGFYVDGVFYARPAATTLDFIDVERIEVLRGPQGTLFGKNTTAGAFNITTKKPEFNFGGISEVSYGNLGFIQAKAAVTGAVSKSVAARFSFSGTQRDGTIYNIKTQQKLNDLNNLGLRGQVLYKPNENLDINFTADYTRQRPQGYAQVIAGVVTTKRADYRQFHSIISDLGYVIPYSSPFDRITDTDTPWRSYQDLGGVSVNIDYKLWNGTLTTTTAWRFWNWNPSNDRDFTGLAALAKSEAPSKHQQWSQEVRWNGDFSDKVNGVFGVFVIGQRLRAAKQGQIEEAGPDQWRFSQNTNSALWQTPGLLDGYGIKTYPSLDSFSGAVFGQIQWQLADSFYLLPGIRVNYDEKKIDFKRITYGGLQTDDPDLIAIKNKVYSDQAFNASIDDTNFSGNFTAAYKPDKKLNIFATVSTGFKPVGLNLGGLPTENGRVMTELAIIKPEYTVHYEIGLKSQPLRNVVLNLTLYNSDIKNYQAQVQAADLSINRGYLAYAEKVRVRGVEADASWYLHNFYVYTNLAYTDGIYKKFTNAPPALEDVGGPSFVDISGGRLPGISKWAGSTGFEWNTNGRLLQNSGQYFFAVDSYYRSEFSSSASPSKYMNIPGYALFNARIGFKVKGKFNTYLWARNVFNKNYFEQLLQGAGSVGHYAAVLGDPRTFGITIRYEW